MGDSYEDEGLLIDKNTASLLRPHDPDSKGWRLYWAYMSRRDFLTEAAWEKHVKRNKKTKQLVLLQRAINARCNKTKEDR